jgi:hypothetical protein
MLLREGSQMLSVVTDSAALRATAARELAAARAGG